MEIRDTAAIFTAQTWRGPSKPPLAVSLASKLSTKS
jgi:hypothetical protein